MTTQKKPQIGILAPGAIGGFLAAVFSKANYKVCCISRDKHIKKLQKTGLTLYSPLFGAIMCKPEFSAQLQTHLDYLFICCKAHQLNTAIKRIKPELIKNTIIIPLQNGVGHIDDLRCIFPQSIVVAASIGIIQVKREGLTIINHLNNNVQMQLAYDQHDVSEQLQSLKSLLTAIGINTTIYNSEADVVWKKLVRLNALSLVTAATNLRLGEVLANKNWNKKLQEIVKETISVAQLFTSTIEFDDVMKTIQQLSPKLKTSLQRDIYQHHTSGELENIAGAVLKIAEQHNIHCPAILYTYQLTKTRIANYA